MCLSVNEQVSCAHLFWSPCADLNALGALESYYSGRTWEKRELAQKESENVSFLWLFTRTEFLVLQKWWVACLFFILPYSGWPHWKLCGHPHSPSLPPMPGQAALIWSSVFKPLPSSLLLNLGLPSSLTCILWLCTLLFCKIELVGTSSYELYCFLLLFRRWS